MNWKKNAFSYILWLVYTVAVSVGVLGITMFACNRMNYPMEYGIVMTAGCLLVVGLLVLGLRKLWRKLDFSGHFDGRIAVRVTEGLLVVGLLAVGIYLRLNQFTGLNDSVEGMIYYEAAVVEAGKSIPQVVHGATYLYLYLLHGVFLLFGNKLAAAVGLQIVLQLLAGVILHFTVRKLAGALAGICATGFFMLSPYMTGETLHLSPAFLFLLAYSLVLLVIGSILQKNNGNPLCYIFVGILAGIIAYLDVFGITLLLFFAGVFSVERESHESFRNSRIAVFLFGILGSVAGFFGAIGVDAYASGKEFFNVLTAWAEIYWPQQFTLTVIAEVEGFLVEAAVLFGILLFGIFSFWCRRHFERMGIWIAETAALIALQSFRMMLQNSGSYAYIYIFLAVLAGIAVESIFIVDEPVAETAHTGNEEISASEDDDIEIIADMSRNAEKEEAPRKVQFLENPLPLPKKHEPKVMDYRIVEDIADKDYDFDFDVADDDDFDI